MDYTEETEFEEMTDPAEEHRQEKARRRISKARQRAHERRRYRKLLAIDGAYNVWVKYDFYKQEYTGRIHRCTNSRKQKSLKRQSNKVIRKAPLNQLSGKGSVYRKKFDYWWELY